MKHPVHTQLYEKGQVWQQRKTDRDPRFLTFNNIWSLRQPFIAILLLGKMEAVFFKSCSNDQRIPWLFLPLGGCCMVFYKFRVSIIPKPGKCIGWRDIIYLRVSNILTAWKKVSRETHHESNVILDLKEPPQHSPISRYLTLTQVRKKGSDGYNEESVVDELAIGISPQG